MVATNGGEVLFLKKRRLTSFLDKPPALLGSECHPVMIALTGSQIKPSALPEVSDSSGASRRQRHHEGMNIPLHRREGVKKLGGRASWRVFPQQVLGP